MFTPPYRLAGIALAFAVALAVSASATAAGDRFPPPPAGEGWKILAGDGSVVTSQCIGQLSSPECIVDTMIACAAWTPARGWPRPSTPDWIGGYHPVCDVLRAEPGNPGVWARTFLGTPGHAGPKDRIYFYRAVPFAITEEMIPWFESDPDDPLHWRAADVAVAVPTVRCLPRDECRLNEWTDEGPIRYRAACPLHNCEEIIPRYGVLAVILRRQEDSWFLVSIHEPHREFVWPYLEAFYGRIR